MLPLSSSSTDFTKRTFPLMKNKNSPPTRTNFLNSSNKFVNSSLNVVKRPKKPTMVIWFPPLLKALSATAPFPSLLRSLPSAMLTPLLNTSSTDARFK